jgi:L-seryl-tRNA(Ser) seleniumtransferase
MLTESTEADKADTTLLKERQDVALESENLQTTLQERLRHLPKMHRLLEDKAIQPLYKRTTRETIGRILRQLLQEQRELLLSGALDKAPDEAWFAQHVETHLEEEERGHLRAVINATGILIHTNLGRAPLCERALRRIEEVASGYCNVEFSIAERRRGKRMDSVRSLLCELSGAEDAHVVNNNAAAVFLALSALATGREAIVSRGELVEIGGSFRIPDVMTSAGVTLREVGTTNRTHLRDYAQALGEETALLTKIHPSNYEIHGFTKEVSLPEIVELGKQHGVPTMMDLGSGALVELPGVSHKEPHWRDVVKTGVDLVTCSGDKLLGGPQAGILLGSKEVIRRIARHPLARALRVDKLTLAALEATLQVYRDGPEAAFREIPILAQWSRTVAELEQWGTKLLRQLTDLEGVECSLEAAEGRVGGGTWPGLVLPTIRLVLQPLQMRPETLESRLRTRHTPVITLLDRGRVLLDLRTLHSSQWPEVERALREAVTTD